jgi:hypothetical protein
MKVGLPWCQPDMLTPPTTVAHVVLGGKSENCDEAVQSRVMQFQKAYLQAVNWRTLGLVFDWAIMVDI